MRNSTRSRVCRDVHVVEAVEESGRCTYHPRLGLCNPFMCSGREGNANDRKNGAKRVRTYYIICRNDMQQV